MSHRPDYTAHVYTLTISNLCQPLENPVSVENQRSWMEDRRNVVKRQIRALCCEESAFVEVTRVKRTAAPKVQSYTLGGGKKKYSFEDVVDRIMQLVASTESNTGYQIDERG